MTPINSINFLTLIQTRLLEDIGMDPDLTESLLKNENYLDAIITVLCHLEKVASFQRLEVWSKEFTEDNCRLIVGSNPFIFPNKITLDEAAASELLEIVESTPRLHLQDVIHCPALAKHLQGKVESLLTMPFPLESSQHGAVLFFLKTKKSLDERQFQIMREAVDLIASILETAALFLPLKPHYVDPSGAKIYLRTLLAIEHVRDRETHTHERLVAAVSAQIGWQLHLPSVRREQLHAAALLHDIGKLMVPLAILRKAEKLTAAEMQMARDHVLHGSEILHLFGLEAQIRIVAKEHHERIDGSGYPSGLREGAIDELASILAGADVLVAMSEARPYHKTYGIAVALEELHAKKGVTFEPRVIDAIDQLMAANQLIFTPNN